MKKFVADFETISGNVDETRVWAWAISEIGNPENFKYGTKIEEFLMFCKRKENYQIYFHNLKFDGSFIFNYLLKNGFTHVFNKEDIKSNTFTTLISEMGTFYKIEIYFHVSKNGLYQNKVTLLDSMNLFPNMSVKNIADTFHLEMKKGEIDYTSYRDVDHILTDEEIDYIKRDVQIVAIALDEFFKRGFKKITIGSNALSFYKNLVKNFYDYYPELDLELHKLLKESYKGGFTYLNPIYKNKTVNKGYVFDVNSLYPSVMKFETYPVGYPVFYEGKYESDNIYKLYIQVLSCSFKLKKGKIPTIQLKNSFAFEPNEYLESSNDEIVTLCLTSVDLELFLSHYDVENLTYHYGYKFMTMSGTTLFGSYIDYFMNEKIKAEKEGNFAMRFIAKRFLNSLYGKFGTNPETRRKYPVLENDILKYKRTDVEIINSVYVPLASFVTSYARKKTIETSQKIRDYSIKKYKKDYYVYSDTDSIHMLACPIENLEKIIDIDKYELGCWKLESVFEKAKFLRQKCYIEKIDNELKVTIAGLPKKLGGNVNFKNFKEGMEIQGKLVPKQIKGGIILTETTFTIK